MKVKLVYVYEITPEDGVGTRNDAIHAAARQLLKDIQNVDSTDDWGVVFKTEILN